MTCWLICKRLIFKLPICKKSLQISRDYLHDFFLILKNVIFANQQWHFARICNFYIKVKLRYIITNIIDVFVNDIVFFVSISISFPRIFLTKAIYYTTILPLMTKKRTKSPSDGRSSTSDHQYSLESPSCPSCETTHQ